MSLLRSLMVGGVAVAIARFLCALLADRRASARRIAWVLLLAPYFTPLMLTGYAYANFSLSLIHHPEVNALLYAALLCWKFTPIAAVILYFAPPPISAEAIHCRRLMDFQRPRGVATFFRGFSTLDMKFNDRKFLFRAGCARGPVAAFAVVFLCAFAEFEMASLMGVKSWTVAVFDANAGGLAVTESLRRMLGPLLCEIAAVATTVAVLGRHRMNPARPPVAGKTTHGLAWLYLIIAFVFVLLIPAGMVLWGTIRGFGLLFEFYAFEA